jgi:hypothetical protein
MILGPLQAIAIGLYLMAIGWQVCVAWLAAIVLGFLPLVGPSFAAYAVYQIYIAEGARPFVLPLPPYIERQIVVQFSPWYLIALFVVPPLLFLFVSLVLKLKRFRIEASTAPRIQIGPTPLGW